MPRGLLLGAVLSIGVVLPAHPEEFRTFEGHGGPIMGLAVSQSGTDLLTTSFDNSVGIWALDDARNRSWLDGHEAAVNTIAYLDGTRAVSGGDDYAVIIWDLAQGAMLHRLEGHKGKVMGLAAAPDGTRLASASWDGTVRIWDAGTGESLAELSGHEGNVNDVAWSADGARIYSASHDGTIIEWDASDFALLRRLVSHGFGVNVITVNDAQGWIAYGALDGGTRALDLETGEELADLTADRRPILALAQSADGGRLAVGDGEGYIMVVDTGTWRIARDFRAALNGPIWALDFTLSGTGVIAGGIADEAYLWPLDAGDEMPRMAELQRAFHVDPDKVSNGERQFMRKCSICHTLRGGGERRAGPSLEGLFGRPAGAIPDYPYSDAVRGSDLVWDETTIDALFDVGPEHYIPGTKMPMQQIAKPEDRADLIEFLKRETKTE